MSPPCASKLSTFWLAAAVAFCWISPAVAFRAGLPGVKAARCPLLRLVGGLGSARAKSPARGKSPGRPKSTRVDSNVRTGGGVERWLKELGLGERVGDFNREAITVEALARMDDSQLQAMGVDRLSDRLTLVGRARDALGRKRLESEIEKAEARQHKLAGVPNVTEVPSTVFKRRWESYRTYIGQMLPFFSGKVRKIDTGQEQAANERVGDKRRLRDASDDERSGG